MLIVAILFLLLVVVFAVQNAQMVPIQFAVWRVDLNLALIVLGSASIGVLIGVVWSWFRAMPTKAKIKELTRELATEKGAKQALDQALQETMKDKEDNHGPRRDDNR